MVSYMSCSLPAGWCICGSVCLSARLRLSEMPVHFCVGVSVLPDLGSGVGNPQYTSVQSFVLYLGYQTLCLTLLVEEEDNS